MIIDSVRKFLTSVFFRPLDFRVPSISHLRSIKIANRVFAQDTLYNALGVGRLVFGMKNTPRKQLNAGRDEINKILTYQIDHTVRVEGCPPFSGYFADMNHSLRIISVHMEDGGVHYTCHIGTVGR